MSSSTSTSVATIPYAIGAVMQVRYVELHAAGRADELRALWLRDVQNTALVVFPITVFVIAAAPELIELLFGAAYLPAVVPFQLFSTVLLHRVASYGAMLQATNQTRSLLVSSLLLVGGRGLHARLSRDRARVGRARRVRARVRHAMAELPVALITRLDSSRSSAPCREFGWSNTAASSARAR